MEGLGSGADPVAWRDAPDSFGRDWDWSRGPEDEGSYSRGAVRGGTQGAIPLIPGP